MIIAIDGPAASGKGTLGKKLAAHYGLRHLDTGLIYRAVAKALLDAGRRPDDAAAAVAAAKALDPARFDEAALKAHAVGEAASVVSAIPEVRAALIAFQRDFAAKPPGAVLDGRDIGTVICPDADVKILRHRHGGGARPPPRRRIPAPRGGRIDEAAVLADILKRDERDSNRAAAPLKQAAGCALARYHAFGYRRGHPGRHRHRRGHPSGPRARLTPLVVGGQSPARASALGARSNHRSESTVLAPAIRDSGGRRRSCGIFGPRFRTPFKPAGAPLLQEIHGHRCCTHA